MSVRHPGKARPPTKAYGTCCATSAADRPLPADSMVSTRCSCRPKAPGRSPAPAHRASCRKPSALSSRPGCRQRHEATPFPLRAPAEPPLHRFEQPEPRIEAPRFAAVGRECRTRTPGQDQDSCGQLYGQRGFVYRSVLRKTAEFSKPEEISTSYTLRRGQVSGVWKG